MQNWKRGVLAASAGTAAILFLKNRKPAGVLMAGVGLAVLASEYPEKFDRVREEVPYYLDRGMRLLEFASRMGQKITKLAETRGHDLLDEFGSYTSDLFDPQLFARVGAQACRRPRRSPYDVDVGIADTRQLFEAILHLRADVNVFRTSLSREGHVDSYILLFARRFETN